MRLVRVAVNAEQLLYRSPGGIGRYTAQLLTVLPRLFPDDDVVAFTARHPRAEVTAALEAVGVDPARAAAAVVLALPRPLLYEGWLGPGRPRLPDLGGAQLIHAPSVAVPPRRRVPLVVTVHDAAPELFPESFPAYGRRFHRRGLAAAARADAVLTVSEAAAAEITAHSAIPAERIRVVHNGVEPHEVEPDRRRRLLEGLGLVGRRYVLWVGSLEPRKGVGTVVGAMASLRRRGAPSAAGVALVLAGYPGWLGGDLVSPDDRAVLGDDLRQLGIVSEDELWSLYRDAAIFAFPSRHEGFGLPVVEAMSQGTPVLAADIAALREVAGPAARLIPPDDVEAWAGAIADLLADDRERERLGAAGVARAGRFGVDAMLRGIRAVYAELVGH
jgi:glycosyltransferase involved in cell wall biosynthesis